MFRNIFYIRRTLIGASLSEPHMNGAGMCNIIICVFISYVASDRARVPCVIVTWAHTLSNIVTRTLIDCRLDYQG